jgi:hypothetical protein
MRKPRPLVIAYCPIICTQCVDCGLDTFAADEWFTSGGAAAFQKNPH